MYSTTYDNLVGKRLAPNEMLYTISRHWRGYLTLACGYRACVAFWELGSGLHLEWIAKQLANHDFLSLKVRKEGVR
jgi:hypothetical protein